MALTVQRFILWVRSGLGLLFCMVSMGVAGLAVLLWQVERRVEVALVLALVAVAVFAFGQQLMRKPQLTIELAGPSWAPGWLFASALPVSWAVAGSVLLIEFLSGLRLSPSGLFSLSGPGTMLPWILLVLPLVLELHVLAHELGHAVVGLLVGMKPLWLRAGLLEINWGNGRARFKVNREPGYLLHGRVLFELPAGGPSLGGQAVMLSAGILVNMAIGLAAFWWGMSHGNVLNLASLMLPLLVAAIGIETAVSNLIPFRSATMRFESDGAQLLRLFPKRLHAE